MKVGEDKPFSDAYWVNNSQQPYIRPFLVEKILEAKLLRRQLVNRAIDWLEINYWKAFSFSAHQIDEVEIPIRRLRHMHLSIEDIEFCIGTECYSHLCFTAPHVDTYAELIDAVRKIAPRMDPKRHVAKTFVDELEVAFGCTYSIDAVREAMKAADLDKGFFSKGRRSQLGPGI